MRKILFIALLLFATPLLAVWPKPPYSQWPCTSGNCGDADNCYSFRAYRVEDALQFKESDKSPRSQYEPTEPYGICSGYSNWCKLPPSLGGVTATVIPGDGANGPRVQLSVSYDFPNNYCQVYDDGAPCRASVWPPKQTLFSPVTRLTVYSENGEPLAIAPAVFETGTWTPTLGIGCGQTATFIVEAKNGGEFVPGCTTDHTVRQTITVTAPANACFPDRRCTDPDCSSGGGASPPRGGGKPIHFGSGDVNVNIPLFTIEQSPLALSMALAYHSSRPMFPNAPLPEPLGSGWTHTFNESLVALDPKANLLYRVDGYGHETVYERIGINQWTPRLPGELRGRETVTLANGIYKVTRLDGTAISFAGGRWISTTDRWGNSITGSYNGANLTRITDSAGRNVELTYNGSQLATIALPGGETWRFSGAPLTAIHDPMHTGSTPWRTITYLPDSNGVARLLHELSDESGSVLEGHEYDAQERGRASYAEGGRDRMTVTYGNRSATVVTVIDGAQTQTSEFTFAYAKGRYLTTKIVGSCASCGGADSESQSFAYDANNRVTTATDGSGHVRRFTYDALGNVIARTEAAGTALARTIAFAYEHATWRDFATKITEPSAAKPGAQKITTRTWNANESVLTVAETGWLNATASETHTVVTTFDARHRVIGVDGPRTDVSDVSSTTHHADGRIHTMTNAAGLTTTFDDYDTYGNARRVIDANGVVTALVTDARGRVTQSTIEAVAGEAGESTAYTTTTTYDGRDRLTRTTAPRGNSVAYEYEDGTNRLLATIRLDENGRQAERQLITRNTIGGSVREEDQSCASPAVVCSSWITKRSQRSTYDAHNRLKEILHAAPAGAKVVYGYDADGLLASIQDKNHATPNTRYTYDALDRLVSTTQTLSGGSVVTRYDYDVMDHLIAVTDANGNVTRYTYDDFGRMKRQESPVSGATTYAHDASGNITTLTDARGATTTSTYDVIQRLLTATTVLGASTETITFTYDTGTFGKGRVASMTDPSGSTTYAYDRRGLQRRETKQILGDTYTTEYEYDQNANRRAIRYPSGRRAEYTFDFADRPLSLRSGTRDIVTSAIYQPFGPESSRTYANGISRNVAHDARYRLTALDVKSGATPLADYRYGYDAAGNITSIADALDPRYSRSFAYDDLHRLTRAESGIALWGSALWEYDAIGNRRSEALGPRVSTYAYRIVAGAVTSQLQSVTESGRGTRSIDYDAAGNERQAGSASFAYSPRNQLSESDGLRYLYDGRGIRVAQIGVSVGPIITTQPLSQPVCPGASVTLSVTASGATSIQWQSSSDGTTWSDISGATSRTLSIAPSSATHYRAIVSNTAASTTSNAAIVTPTALAIEPASNLRYGDINADGSVNAADVAALRIALTNGQPLGVSLAVADLDGDGIINAIDLSLLGGFTGGTVTCLPRFNAFTTTASSPSAASRIATNQASSNPTQYFFYTPELALLAETEIRAGGGTPAIAVEYLWFNGTPVAEERPTETRLTFPDHLGTPFLQTSTTGTPLWRVEYEPYGAVYAARTGTAADQRLRFPGQEYDEQSPERAYNVFRWYRNGWGRYTQVDPIGVGGDGVLLFVGGESPVFVGSGSGWKLRDTAYSYALGNPSSWIDPYGLAGAANVCCDGNGGFTVCWNQIPKSQSEKACIEQHESDHVKWLTDPVNKCNDQCKDPTGRPRPRGYKTWTMTPSQWHAMECRGYEQEVRCLKKELSTARNKSDVLWRINQMIAEAKRKHNCNTSTW